MAMEKNGNSANNAGNNTSLNLKSQLINILENLEPAVKDKAWLKRQIKHIINRELEDSYLLISNIITAFCFKLQHKQSELFNAGNENTEELRNFYLECQNHIKIIPDPNETIEETITRVLNEIPLKHVRKPQSNR